MFNNQYTYNIIIIIIEYIQLNIIVKSLKNNILIKIINQIIVISPYHLNL